VHRRYNDGAIAPCAVMVWHQTAAWLIAGCGPRHQPDVLLPITHWFRSCCCFRRRGPAGRSRLGGKWSQKSRSLVCPPFRPGATRTHQYDQFSLLPGSCRAWLLSGGDPDGIAGVHEGGEVESALFPEVGNPPPKTDWDACDQELAVVGVADQLCDCGESRIAVVVGRRCTVVVHHSLQISFDSRHPCGSSGTHCAISLSGGLLAQSLCPPPA